MDEKFLISAQGRCRCVIFPSLQTINSSDSGDDQPLTIHVEGRNAYDERLILKVICISDHWNKRSVK